MHQLGGVASSSSARLGNAGYHNLPSKDAETDRIPGMSVLASSTPPIPKSDPFISHSQISHSIIVLITE